MLKLPYSGSERRNNFLYINYFAKLGPDVGNSPEFPAVP